MAIYHGHSLVTAMLGKTTKAVRVYLTLFLTEVLRGGFAFHGYRIAIVNYFPLAVAKYMPFGLDGVVVWCKVNKKKLKSYTLLNMLLFFERITERVGHLTEE